jgi:hypothetical protein
VCKAWDSYFKSKVGPRLVITNKTWDRLESQMKVNSSISKVKLSDVTVHLGFVIRSCHEVRVTSLSLHRILLPANILWSLKHFRNLKRISFSYILLERFPEQIQNTESIDLPHVERIYLYSKTGNGFGATDEDILMQRADNNFPNDELFILDMLSSFSLGGLESIYLFCSEDVFLSQPLQHLFDAQTNINNMCGLTKLIYKNRRTIKELVVGPGVNLIVMAWRFQPGELIWRKPMQLSCCDSYLEIPSEWNILFPTQRSLDFVRVNNAYRHWTGLEVN